MAKFDIVVGSTSAPDTVFSAAAVAAAMTDQPGRPLILLDLALPRDIDPMVARLSHVFLYNLDDLAQISTANRAARAGEVTRARSLLSTKADLLWRTLVRPAPAARPPLRAIAAR